MEKRKLIKKNDLILIVGLIVFSIIFFFIYDYLNKANTVKAELLVNGKVLNEISLEENGTFEFQKNHNVKFEVKDGQIRFLESDCPDKICVNTGFISKGGQTAVCLPNAVSIRIVGGDAEATLDGIAQ